MKLTDDHFIHTVWFVPGGDKDFLCTLYRVGPGPWICRFRFRYHHEGPDRDPFDHKDEKSTYEATADDQSADALARMMVGAREVTRTLATEWGTAVDEVLVEGGADAYLDAMRGKPWVHMRVLEPEQ
jgi:hypothetical protein